MGEKKKIARSTSYPSLPLEESLKKLHTLKDSHGINGEYDREETAKGMGYGSLSGSSARAVAALVQFGLLNRNKDQYSISELGKKYLMPIEEGQIQEAIKEAALKPVLLRKIYEEYNGQPLPGQLKNILTITYGIQGAATNVALRVVKQTFQSSGLLQENGILANANNEAASNATVEKPQTPSDDSETHTIIGSVPDKIISAGDPKMTNLTEQGINLSGDGWQLTVLLRTAKRHSADTRRKVRDLIEKADEVADALYAEDNRD